MKTLLTILLCGLLLGGCATQQRTLTLQAWNDTGTTSTLAVFNEQGIPAVFGETHLTMAIPGAVIGLDKTKNTIGSLGTGALTVVGGLAGAYLAGAPGLILGGAGGATAGVLTKDKPTTATTVSAAELAPYLLKSGARPAPAVAAQGVGADQVIMLLGVEGASDFIDLPIPGLDPIALLKTYIEANPEKCKAASSLGVPLTLQLIDILASRKATQ